MSRSPVSSSARPPASTSSRASDPSRSSASSVVVCGHGPPERLEERGRVRELRRQVLGDLRPLGVVAGVELDPVGGGVGPKQSTTARGSCVGDLRRIRLVAPSSALTGSPSAPLIESGRAKNAIEQGGGVDGQQRRAHRRHRICKTS